MTTRRQLFQFAGGSAVGLLLTPAPWRLITDTALWSENWPGVPRPARGEIRARFTHCALCPAGCAVRARCVGDQPIAMAGVGGGICPYGVTGHHLPYHPDRLRTGNPQEAAAAVSAALAQKTPDEQVAVLDLRPGRTASWTYRRAMAALRGGIYLAPEDASCAIDLAAARTVLSLGAPVLDGWGRPARAAQARANFRLIQAEAFESGTAAVADEWLAVKPGTESMLGRAAAGIVSVGQAAEFTGLAEERIARVVRTVRENGPSLILAPGMSAEALAWNVAIGSWGKTVLPRREAPVPKEWSKAAPATTIAAVKDGAVRVLLVDESVPGVHVPWAEIQPKLARDAVVVAFAWSRSGLARHATHVLAAAVYPEAAGDVAASIDSTAAEFRLTAALVPAPEGVVDPAEFVSGLVELDAKNALRERADAIHAMGRGSLQTYADGKIAAVKNLKADDFWKALNAGGCWTGDREPAGPPPKTQAATAEAADINARWPFLLALEDPQGAALASPLLSKLSQESRLRLGAGRAAVHPGAGFADGVRAVLETPYGRRAIELQVNESVPPGIVLAGGEEIAEIRGADSRARVARI